MSFYSVVQTNIYPAPFVRCTDYLRAAQIIARLLQERFPESSFGIVEGGAFGAPDAAAAISDYARSEDVERMTHDELLQEAHENPDFKFKWHIYFYDHGVETSRGPRFQLNKYLDHDLRVREKCENDPDLKGHIHCYHPPTMEELYAHFDKFKKSREAA